MVPDNFETQLNGFGERVNRQEVVNGEHGIEIINMKKNIDKNCDDISTLEKSMNKIDKKQTIVYAMGTLAIIAVTVIVKFL